ncbi:TPA: hypothetical protein I2T40_04640 [Staphylococcus aureus]|nr:hypothetical protein [Staphylococcus aureus]
MHFGILKNKKEMTMPSLFYKCYYFKASLALVTN